jgi:hypothetical protein
MFIHMVTVQMVEMPVVQIIRVAVMKHGGMATPGSMLMTMLIVNRMVAHGGLLSMDGVVASQYAHSRPLIQEWSRGPRDVSLNRSGTQKFSLSG